MNTLMAFTNYQWMNSSTIHTKYYRVVPGAFSCGIRDGSSYQIFTPLEDALYVFGHCILDPGMVYTLEDKVVTENEPPSIKYTPTSMPGLYYGKCHITQYHTYSKTIQCALQGLVTLDYDAENKKKIILDCLKNTITYIDRNGTDVTAYKGWQPTIVCTQPIQRAGMAETYKDDLVSLKYYGTVKPEDPNITLQWDDTAIDCMYSVANNHPTQHILWDVTNSIYNDVINFKINLQSQTGDRIFGVSSIGDVYNDPDSTQHIDVDVPYILRDGYTKYLRFPIITTKTPETGPTEIWPENNIRIITSKTTSADNNLIETYDGLYQSKVLNVYDSEIFDGTKVESDSTFYGWMRLPKQHVINFKDTVILGYRKGEKGMPMIWVHSTANRIHSISNSQGVSTDVKTKTPDDIKTTPIKDTELVSLTTTDTGVFDYTFIDKYVATNPDTTQVVDFGKDMIKIKMTANDLINAGYVGGTLAG